MSGKIMNFFKFKHFLNSSELLNRIAQLEVKVEQLECEHVYELKSERSYWSSTHFFYQICKNCNKKQYLTDSVYYKLKQEELLKELQVINKWIK